MIKKTIFRNLAKSSTLVLKKNANNCKKLRGKNALYFQKQKLKTKLLPKGALVFSLFLKTKYFFLSISYIFV